MAVITYPTDQAVRAVAASLREVLDAYDNDSVALESDDEMWERARSALARFDELVAEILRIDAERRSYASSKRWWQR